MTSLRGHREEWRPARAERNGHRPRASFAWRPQVERLEDRLAPSAPGHSSAPALDLVSGAAGARFHLCPAIVAPPGALSGQTESASPDATSSPCAFVPAGQTATGHVPGRAEAVFPFGELPDRWRADSRGQAGEQQPGFVPRRPNPLTTVTDRVFALESSNRWDNRGVAFDEPTDTAVEEPVAETQTAQRPTEASSPATEQTQEENASPPPEQRSEPPPENRKNEPEPPAEDRELIAREEGTAIRSRRAADVPAAARLAWEFKCHSRALSREELIADLLERRAGGPVVAVVFLLGWASPSRPRAEDWGADQRLQRPAAALPRKRPRLHPFGKAISVEAGAAPRAPPD